MFVEVTPFSWVEPVTHLGVPGLLTIAVTVLWRALGAERDSNQAWQQASLKEQAALNQIPVALDRFRVETLQGQQSMLSEVRTLLNQRCGAR